MKYFEVRGSIEDVESSFADLGIDVSSANVIVKYLSKNKDLLGKDEYIEVSYESPSFPPGVLGLVIPKTNCYINVKITTIVVMALFADISFSEGVASMLLGLCGFSNTAITKLSEEWGEKCIVRETLSLNPKIGSTRILTSFKGKCCNKDLFCKFRDGDKCNCTEDDILKIYKKLADRNMFKPDGEYFKYQW